MTLSLGAQTTTNIPSTETTPTRTVSPKTVDTTPVTPPVIDYSTSQGILSALHTEPGTMRIEDYQYSPQEEEEHVKRMVRLAELRSNSMSVDDIRHLLGFKTEAQKQQEADALKRNDSDNMRAEIDDLRQQLAEMRQLLQQQNPSMGNGSRVNYRRQTP